MEFNIQRYLETMEDRAIERHAELVQEFKGLSAIVSNHTTRIVVLEGTDKRRRWYAATLLTAMVTFLFDLVINHFGGHK